MFFCTVDKISADQFEDEITPSLKTNDGLKFSQDVALNRVKEKKQLGYKHSYNVLRE